jgi:lactate dehydrogenase-like 2-hydroxyacid dehydrogenase
MKIFVTQRIPLDALSRLEAFGPTRMRPRSRPPSEDELIRGARTAEGILCQLTDPLTARVVAGCPRLRAVSTVAVGTDNIDLDACRRRGIRVFNTPAVLTESTADLVWGLILAAARRIPEADRFTRRGRFRGWALDLMLGVDVHGKTLGVIGPGRIGRAVARRAAGFDMRILFCGRRKRRGSVPLGRLLRESDVIVVSTPLTASTRGLIGDREFALMKPTAVLVNIGRGPVVQERALIGALRRRRIFAAGLDVYEHEPRVAEDLRRLESVVLLPHIGSATRETRGRMVSRAVDQLIEALK